MTIKTTQLQALEARAAIFKALGHPGRLQMLEMLAGGERCVCDLQAAVGSDMSTVSKHLALLKSAGLVEDTRRGAWVWYRLKHTVLPTLLNCVDSVLRSDLAERQEVVACCSIAVPKLRVPKRKSGKKS